MEKVLGCPKCGRFGFISPIRHCWNCNVPMVLGDKAEFIRLNEAYAEEIYGKPLPQKD